MKRISKKVLIICILVISMLTGFGTTSKAVKPETLDEILDLYITGLGPITNQKGEIIGLNTASDEITEEIQTVGILYNRGRGGPRDIASLVAQIINIYLKDKGNYGGAIIEDNHVTGICDVNGKIINLRDLRRRNYYCNYGEGRIPTVYGKIQ